MESASDKLAAALASAIAEVPTLLCQNKRMIKLYSGLSARNDRLDGGSAPTTRKHLL